MPNDEIVVWTQVGEHSIQYAKARPCITDLAFTELETAILRMGMVWSIYRSPLYRNTGVLAMKSPIAKKAPRAKLPLASADQTGITQSMAPTPTPGNDTRAAHPCDVVG